MRTDRGSSSWTFDSNTSFKTVSGIFFWLFGLCSSSCESTETFPSEDIYSLQDLYEKYMTIYCSEFNFFLRFPFSYQRLPIAKLVNIPDISMVMATVAATFMDNNREQLIWKFTVLSISLKEKKDTNQLTTTSKLCWAAGRTDPNNMMVGEGRKGDKPVHKMAVGWFWTGRCSVRSPYSAHIWQSRSWISAKTPSGTAGVSWVWQTKHEQQKRKVKNLD